MVLVFFTVNLVYKLANSVVINIKTQLYVCSVNHKKIYVMKTIRRKTLLVVFMFGTLFNYANQMSNFNTANDTKEVHVVFKNVKKGHILTIKDQTGEILHSENVIKEGKLSKVFDFSSLENGKYKIELEKDTTVVIKPFSIKSNTAVFQKKLEKVIFKPIIKNKENTVYISKKVLSNEPVKIILYYNDNLIYTETITHKTDLNRVYRLDKKEKGNYKAVVVNNVKSYIKEFKI